MSRLIFSRIAWFLPTLLAIIGVTFLITKLSPVDPVSFYLDPDAPTLASPVEQLVIYDQTASQLGLNQPVFYFSILPYSTDQSFYALTLSYQRLAHQLLMQGMDWSVVKVLLAKLEILINNDDEHARKIAYPISQTDVDGLVKASEDIKRDAGNTHQVAVEEIHGHLSDLDGQIIGFLPYFLWNGKENQFHRWWTGALTFDFGYARQDGQLVSSKLMYAIRWTLCINLTSLLIAYVFSIPLGLYSGWYAGSVFDRLVSTLLSIFYAVPIFWMATLLVVFFSTDEYGNWTNIFPSAGIWTIGQSESFADLLRQNAGQFVIPILTLATSISAYITRQVRSAVLDEKYLEYVHFARAKGLSEHRILWRHVFRNASFPLITMLASLLPASIAGSLVLEIICNIPGVGRLLYEGIFNQDWPVVLGVVSITAVLTILGLLLSDIIYRLVDPRIRTT